MFRNMLTPPASAPGSIDAALAGAAPTPFWLDDPARPDPRPRLRRPTSADLAIVGGGFSGLWTALLARERHPDWDIVLAEGARIGWAASGRNGGFCAATLTHGERNGQRHFPGEEAELRELGRANLDEIEQAVAVHQIDCDFRRSGAMVVATEPHQVGWLRNEPGEFLDADAVRAELNSPTYLAGLCNRRDVALVNPARLAWGLARAAEEAGIRILERTPVLGIGRNGTRLALATPHATITARKAALGTNAFRSLVRRVRLHTVPVYDHALVTEPLSASQLGSIGWRNRQGVSDLTNQFHYYRMTADHRILWGGYDAIYHYGRHIRTRYDQRPLLHGSSPSTSSRRFRSSTACDSPTSGAARSTPARGSARSSAPRTAATWPTRWGTPGWASARPGSARRSCWTCWTSSRLSGPACAWSRAARFRSRRSRWPTRASSSPGGRWRGPTAGRASATCCSARWTGSGWATTPDRAPLVPLAFR
jgi:glycine/D-amino acid oxidase-like deaminating enzyme